MGMNKEMKSDYDKALKLYHNGYLKKSLQCCEDAISKDLKNNSVLNLKGLILYLKGDLQGAITVWKINKDFNDDEISKTYIKDARDDEVRQKEFEKAKKFIKNLHINEAIESLNICKKSDFNSIQVNNLLAFCEFTKGNYNKSIEYINKSLEIDKKDANTLSMKKKLDEFNEKKPNKSLVTIGIIFIISILLMVLYFLKHKEDKQSNFDKDVNITIENNIENTKSENNEDNEEKNANVNSSEEVKENLNDIEKITPEKIKENYIMASTHFENGDYIKSKESLESVVGQSYESHLNDDILFLIGSTYDKLGDLNNSEKYFKEYISLYENGDYIEEAYYKLALQYKNIDIEKSKNYANELISSYPESIYNNENIDSILQN